MILHEVDWDVLEKFVKRVARLAIAADMESDALELLRNLRDDCENEPLVSFLNLRAISLLERISESRLPLSIEAGSRPEMFPQVDSVIM
jgi:hypothetical protein